MNQLAAGCRRPALFISICTAALMALAAGPAFAGTVSVTGTTLNFSATGGEVNMITVSQVAGGYTVTDTAPITGGAGCSAAVLFTVTCATPVNDFLLSLGDMDDTATVMVPLPGTLRGEGGGDTLSATLAAHEFEGGAGTDTVSYDGRTAPVVVDIEAPAAGGDDGQAGEGDDVHDDVEVVTGGSGGDTLTGDGLANTLNGGSGADTLNGGSGIDNLNGGNGSDAMNGGAGGDTLNGDADGDTLRGDADGDTLNGGTGDDTFDEGSASNGADTINGGDGAGDTVTYAARGVANGVTVSMDGVADDGETFTNENDNVQADVENAAGGAGQDTITGSAADNTITGNGNTDTLNGGGGNDRVAESAAATGADDIIGGTGMDIVDYSARTSPLTVTTGAAADDGDPAVNAGLGERDDVRDDVEIVEGGTAGDTLTGDAVGTGETLNGNGGGDTLNGGGGNGNMLNGGAGNDTFSQGGAANGGDAMNGGDGTDTADYSARAASVNVTTGGGGLDGAAGEADEVASDVETIAGGSAGDSLTGDDGAETLRGNNGGDQLDGGAGDDTFDEGQGAGSTGNDILTGGTGTDTADYSARTAALTIDLDEQSDDGVAGESDRVRPDIEVVSGGSADDTITGADGAQTLRGNGGGDTLRGNAGDDILDEGTAANGADTLDGGSGTDTVDYSARTAALAVTVGAGASGDGEPGNSLPLDDEGDDVQASVERVEGGTAADTLTGGTGIDTLNGNGGNDTLNGGDSPDALNGGAGDDTVNGDNGNDVLHGDDGADTISGGAGDDGILGDAGADSMSGDAGADLIVARDGTVDVVNCGADSDGVTADANDNVAADCEVVDRGTGTAGPTPGPGQAPGPGPGTEPGGDTRAPRAGLRVTPRQRLSTLLRRGLGARISCSERCSVRADLVIDRRTARRLRLGRLTVVGRARSSLARRGAKRVTVRFNRRSRSALRRARTVRSFRMTLRVRVVDRAGNDRTVSRRILVRR